MIRTCNITSNPIMGKPRASGDDPEMGIDTDAVKESKPRASGDDPITLHVTPMDAT